MEHDIGQFGFDADLKWQYDYKNGLVNGRATRKVFDGYEVSLPHSCDDWVISNGNDYGGVPKAKALERLDLFIEEAKAVRERLIALPDIEMGARVEVDLTGREEGPITIFKEQL